MSQGMYETLAAAGRLEAAGQDAYVLRNPAVEGQTIPNLTVRVRRRVTRVGADGVLGLDFLGQFDDIHVARRAGVIEQMRPPTDRLRAVGFQADDALIQSILRERARSRLRSQRRQSHG